ncbi:MAG: hypothetical protein REJ23_07810 [Brevundimonas sp.]|nr:hypothetical protein [Brevundimonas sp.]
MFAAPMSRYAVLIPVSRDTRDHRTIRWLECELHDDHVVTRDALRPFFSVEEARSWAEARGYEVRT